VFTDTPRSKLDRAWTGPFLIDSKQSEVTYAVRSLVDNSVWRVHVNRIFHLDPPGVSRDPGERGWVCNALMGARGGAVPAPLAASLSNSNP